MNEHASVEYVIRVVLKARDDMSAVFAKAKGELASMRTEAAFLDKNLASINDRITQLNRRASSAAESVGKLKRATDDLGGSVGQVIFMQGEAADASDKSADAHDRATDATERYTDAQVEAAEKAKEYRAEQERLGATLGKAGQDARREADNLAKLRQEMSSLRREASDTGEALTNKQFSDLPDDSEFKKRFTSLHEQIKATKSLADAAAEINRQNTESYKQAIEQAQHYENIVTAANMRSAAAVELDTEARIENADAIVAQSKAEEQRLATAARAEAEAVSQSRRRKPAVDTGKDAARQRVSDALAKADADEIAATKLIANAKSESEAAIKLIKLAHKNAAGEADIDRSVMIKRMKDQLKITSPKSDVFVLLEKSLKSYQKIVRETLTEQERLENTQGLSENLSQLRKIRREAEKSLENIAADKKSALQEDVQQSLKDKLDAAIENARAAKESANTVVAAEAAVEQATQNTTAAKEEQTEVIKKQTAASVEHAEALSKEAEAQGRLSQAELESILQGREKVKQRFHAVEVSDEEREALIAQGTLKKNGPKMRAKVVDTYGVEPDQYVMRMRGGATGGRSTANQIVANKNFKWGLDAGILKKTDSLKEDAENRSKKAALREAEAKEKAAEEAEAIAKSAASRREAEEAAERLALAEQLRREKEERERQESISLNSKSGPKNVDEEVDISNWDDISDVEDDDGVHQKVSHRRPRQRNPQMPDAGDAHSDLPEYVREHLSTDKSSVLKAILEDFPKQLRKATKEVLEIHDSTLR